MTEASLNLPPYTNAVNAAKTAFDTATSAVVTKAQAALSGPLATLRTDAAAFCGSCAAILTDVTKFTGSTSPDPAYKSLGVKKAEFDKAYAWVEGFTEFLTFTDAVDDLQSGMDTLVGDIAAKNF